MALSIIICTFVCSFYFTVFGGLESRKKVNVATKMRQPLLEAV